MTTTKAVTGHTSWVPTGYQTLDKALFYYLIFLLTKPSCFTDGETEAQKG